MAELGRVAFAALHTSPILRVAPLRRSTWATACRRRISTSPALRSNDKPPVQSTPASTISSAPHSQQKLYSTFGKWSDPTRPARVEIEDDIANLRRPSSQSYEFVSKQDTGSANFASDMHMDAYMFVNKKVDSLPSAPPRKHNMRLVPRLGRTVPVRKNNDVARSFKLLAMQVSGNRVRQEWYRQRFHERPGLKRKRLASERWQFRFKKGFKAAVSRVQELTRQGW